MIVIFRYRKSENDVTNYIRWLCDDVGLNYDIYSNVASTLLTYEFNDEIDNDINRTFDAIAIREEFERDYDVMLDIHTDESAGLLEVLVSLARRAADIMYDAHGEDKTDHYFWLMFCNLGLDKYDDGRYSHQKVVDICRKFNKRDWDGHGKGGPFVIKHPPLDIKSVEIWSVMNWYLTEEWYENGEN